MCSCTTSAVSITCTQCYRCISSSLAPAQKDVIMAILANYDADNLSSEDARNIMMNFFSQGIEICDELMIFISELGF